MDFRLAVRSLLRRPAFTVLAVFILALGIGASTAIFSVVYQVMLRPLPYKHADRIFAISRTWKDARFGQQSGPDFVDYRNGSRRSFAAMAAYANGVDNVVINKTGAFTGISAVSEDFFRVFSASPVAGRLIDRQDFHGMPAHVAVVNENFWRRRFSGQPWTPGRKLFGNNNVYEIVGLVPAAFHFPEDSQTEVWIPPDENLASASRTGHNYLIVGRLKEGVSESAAQVELSVIASRIARTYDKAGNGVLLSPLSVFNTHRFRSVLFVLFGAVLLVLLIACANVANLLLARGMGRLREFSIRAALGASFTHLIRQLLIESLLLSLLGCAFAVILAASALPLLIWLAPQTVPGLENTQLSLPVLCFAIAVSICASVVCGVAPALQAARVDPTEGLRSGSSRGSIGGATAHTRNWLISAEIALSLVLLACSGLLLRSFSALLNVDLGFRPEHVLSAEISADANSKKAYESFYQPLLERLGTKRAYGSVALASDVPGDANFFSNGSYIVSGQTMNDFSMASPQADFHLVSPNYFATLRIPLFAGRDFNTRDTAARDGIAVINQSLAKRAFPRGDAVGQRILCGYDQVSSKWMRIIGVVQDARLENPGAAASPAIFMPFAQHSRVHVYLLLRSPGEALAQAAPLQADIRSLDPASSARFKLLTDNLSQAVATPRFVGSLFSLFAALAILLAAVGIYGVMSFSVAQRTAEMGLRAALGATRMQLFQLVFRSALRFTTVGFVIGFLASLAATRLIDSQLFGISATDPFSYAAALFVLLLIALLATYLPARRAARVEPLVALRHE